MQSKKIIFVIVLFLWWQGNPLLAQKGIINGRVIDASNGEAVQYANIGLVGTYMGTATDLDGNFELDVKTVTGDNEITISAVGYRTRVLTITRLKAIPNLVVELIPVTYGIDEVDIKAPSRIFYGMLRVAVRQIPNNYLSVPYSATALYSESAPGHHRRLNLLYTDAEGYRQRNYTDAFMNRRYRIESGTRDFEALPFDKGLVRIEELLNFDAMRNPGNVLDTAFFEHFEISEKDRYVTEGRHVLVLQFNCTQPQYTWSGDALVEAMNGEVHIVEEDLSILKTVTHITSDGRSRHGRSFFLSDDMKDPEVEKIEYSVETSYVPVTGKLVLKEVMWKNRTFTKGAVEPEEVTYSLSFKSIEPGKTAVETFTRHYYDDVSEKP